jgi:hypothetical protein
MFVETLCKDQKNKEVLVSEFNLLGYLRPILISLYDRIKTIINQLDLVFTRDDKIKNYVCYGSVDGKHFLYRMKLFDRVDNSVGCINLEFASENYYNMDGPLIWRYTSLYQDFSYFETLYSFLCSLYILGGESELISNSSYFDLVVVVNKSFCSLKKLMDTPYSDIVLIHLNKQVDFYLVNINLVRLFFESFWNGAANKEINSLSESLIYFLLFYIKNSSFEFLGSIECLKRLSICCQTCVGVIRLWKENSNDKYFDLIKFLFKNSKLEKCLIDIFNALDSLSYSKQLPHFLSFLSSVSPSEDTKDILKNVTYSILLLCGKNSPEEVKLFARLGLFEEDPHIFSYLR